MLILGIDTAARPGTLALVREDRSTLANLELVSLPSGQPSETLIPAIAGLLARHGLAKSDLSLIAVASGPGSFTGLRVALASAKGLAEALAIPILPVSVLEAVALTAAGQASEALSGAETQPRRLLAVLDAQRNEVYFGEFLLDPTTGIAQTLHEEIVGFAEFIASASWPGRAPANSRAAMPTSTAAPGSEAIPDSASAPVLTPDEALAFRLRHSSVAAVLVARPTAQEIAGIACRKFLAGIRADPATLDANYLRRSEAELLSAPKLGIAPRSGRN